MRTNSGAGLKPGGGWLRRLKTLPAVRTVCNRGDMSILQARDPTRNDYDRVTFQDNFGCCSRSTVVPSHVHRRKRVPGIILRLGRATRHRRRLGQFSGAGGLEHDAEAQARALSGSVYVRPATRRIDPQGYVWISYSRGIQPIDPAGTVGKGLFGSDEEVSCWYSMIEISHHVRHWFTER